jgi:hypothetical protein
MSVSDENGGRKVHEAVAIKQKKAHEPRAHAPLEGDFI